MSPSVDIVIVNWNSGEQLCDCLNSIAAASKEGLRLLRVVVVDNASSDSSADNLVFPKLPIKLVRNANNRGFAAACNQGAAGTTSDHLLFLNPDVRLFPDSLTVPVQFLERERDCRIAMCGIQLLDSQGHVARTCARFPTLLTFLVQIFRLDRISPGLLQGLLLADWDHSESREVHHTTGAFLLIRRYVFEQLGGFDERFFVYLEDLDLSYRCYRAGWRSYYLAAMQAYHRGGGCSQKEKSARLFYALRSRVLYAYKHLGWVRATCLLLATALVEPVARLALATAHRSLLEMKETLQAFVQFWRALPSLLTVTRQ